MRATERPDPRTGRPEDQGATSAADVRTRAARTDGRRLDDDRSRPGAGQRFDVDAHALRPATGRDRDVASRERLARDLFARSGALLREADGERRRADDDRARAASLDERADAADRAADTPSPGSVEHGGDPSVPADAAVPADRAVADDARAAGHVAYDSGARRDAWAADLERRGVDRDLAAARVRADVSNARPATHAPLRGARRPRPAVARTPTAARSTRGR